MYAAVPFEQQIYKSHGPEFFIHADLEGQILLSDPRRASSAGGVLLAGSWWSGCQVVPLLRLPWMFYLVQGAEPSHAHLQGTSSCPLSSGTPQIHLLQG